MLVADDVPNASQVGFMIYDVLSSPNTLLELQLCISRRRQ